MFSVVIYFNEKVVISANCAFVKDFDITLLFNSLIKKFVFYKHHKIIYAYYEDLEEKFIS